jgi:ABC-type glycerol-3-phosphate transport system substrate-binding protein
MQFYLCVPVWNHGGELIKEDESAWSIDSDQVVEIVQQHADMYLKDKSIPVPADVQGISWLFATGRLAMSWGHKFRVNELANAKFEVGMIGTPKGKARRLNRDGPNATGIATIAKRRDDSYVLARFLGGAEAAPAYIGGGATIPVRKSLANSEHFKKGMLPFEKIEVHNDSAASVRPWRIPGKAPEIVRAFTAQWERILTGQAAPRDAMKAAKAQMDELLK